LAPACCAKPFYKKNALLHAAQSRFARKKDSCTLRQSILQEKNVPARCGSQFLKKNELLHDKSKSNKM